jgi:hypothetical protein
MAPGTELRDQAVLRAEPRAAEGLLKKLWGKIKLVVIRSVFWSYERGTWQYDLIVLAILCFIFLTPRRWFEDRPTLQLTDLRHQQGIVEMGRSKEGARYLVDARLVEAMGMQKPEDAIREILRHRLQKPFTVRSIDVVQNRNHVILGYTVVVAP